MRNKRKNKKKKEVERTTHEEGENKEGNQKERKELMLPLERSVVGIPTSKDKSEAELFIPKVLRQVDIEKQGGGGGWVMPGKGFCQILLLNFNP